MKGCSLITVMSKREINLTNRYLGQLHQAATGSVQQNARDLRRGQTQAEAKLWSLLRNRQLKGKKFRRQHPIGRYVVDFYCHECKIVVEVDGNFHLDAESQQYDKSRTASLNEIGITVLRFWNEQVMRDCIKVLQKISKYLD